VIELHPILGYAASRVVRPSAAAPVLDCSDIPYRNFRVRWDVPNPDPHHFDGNPSGIGCETEGRACFREPPAVDARA
jgi:hypothetical protein